MIWAVSGTIKQLHKNVTRIKFGEHLESSKKSKEVLEYVPSLN